MLVDLLDQTEPLLANLDQDQPKDRRN